MNTILLLLCVLCIVVYPVIGLTNRGLITWQKYGATQSTEIAGGNGGVTVSGNQVGLSQQYAPRVYLMDDSSGSTFYRFPNMIGKTFQFTANVAQTTCGCNAAIYFVDFPAGEPNSFYCDAQGSGASDCVELDIMESNTKAFQSTLHCGNSAETMCTWGCGWNIKSANGFGSTINPAQPFQVDYSFVGSGSTLSEIIIQLSQSGKTLTHTYTDSSCGNSYVSALSSAVSSGNLVLVISYWGGSMSWLDGCTGTESCPTNTWAYFSNFQLIDGISAVTSDSSAISPSSNFVIAPLFIALICVAVFLILGILIGLVIWKRKKSHTQEIV